MEVILMNKVRNLGGLGEKVKVKPGYARNYLIPKGIAKYATPANLAEFEERRAELEKAENEALAAAQVRQQELEALGPVTITAQAGSEGKLFGSIGTQGIAEAITEAGVAVERKEVRLAEGAFRHVGEYSVTLHLHSDVDATITVLVKPAETTA